MADTIKIYSFDVDTIKIGSANVDAVYVGASKVYPTEEPTPPTPQTLQWVTFSNGDTIPSDLDIYGFSGVCQNLYDTFGYGESFTFTPVRNYIDWFIVDCSYGGTVLNTEVLRVIFSEDGCDGYYNQGATVSGTIQLYIYA